MKYIFDNFAKKYIYDKILNSYCLFTTLLQKPIGIRDKNWVKGNKHPNYTSQFCYFKIKKMGSWNP